MDVLYTFLGIITRKLAATALDRFIGSKKSRGRSFYASCVGVFYVQLIAVCVTVNGTN